jgi:hypothetical protein
MSNLNPDKALIFRITHIANVPWLLEHGLHCRNSPEFDPNFRNIGNPELISKRHTRVVPIPPGGRFSDYVAVLLHAVFDHALQHSHGYGGVP